MSARRLSLRALAAALPVCILAFGAAAQNTAMQESVEGRGRPEYDPIGVLMADLLGYQDRSIDPKTGLRMNAGIADTIIISPKIGFEVGYNDNLFKTDANKIGDGYYSINPSIGLRTDWDNHELFATAELVETRYFRKSDENFRDIKLTAGGRLDLTDFESFKLTFSQNWLHEERGTFDRNFGSRPTEYTSTGVNLVWQYQRDSILHRFTGDATYLNYRDTDALALADLNQDDRDRWEYTATERLGYETFDDTIIWIEPQVGWRRYSNKPDDLGFFRNSVGYQMLVGATYDATSITAFEGGIGYMWRNYEDPRIATISGIAAKALATWNTTDLLTLTGKVERSIKEQILANTGGQVDTTASLRADYEFLYNTIFNASVGRQWSTIEGAGVTPSSTDTYWTLSLGMRHLVNEYATIRAGWTLSMRDSSVVGGSYDQNLMFLRLELYI